MRTTQQNFAVWEVVFKSETPTTSSLLHPQYNKHKMHHRQPLMALKLDSLRKFGRIKQQQNIF